MGDTRTLETTADTEAFGTELATMVQAGDVIVLDGPLGAGKTTLTRGLACGLGVYGRVHSPTFVIAHRHEGKRSSDGQVGPALVHMDMYRLRDTDVDLFDELDALDIDTELDDAVIVVEWGADVISHIVSRYLYVQLERAEGTECRTARWRWIT